MPMHKIIESWGYQNKAGFAIARSSKALMDKGRFDPYEVGVWNKERQVYCSVAGFATLGQARHFVTRALEQQQSPRIWIEVQPSP